MPTDPVLTLIAEMRAKADAMPQGPYDVDFYHPLNHPTIHTVCAGHAYLDQRKHMNYFASLDPTIVRALLDVVEGQMMTDTLHTLDDDWSVNRRKRNAGMEALRQLAADRVAS